MSKGSLSNSVNSNTVYEGKNKSWTLSLLFPVKIHIWIGLKREQLNLFKITKNKLSLSIRGYNEFPIDCYHTGLKMKT